MSACSHSHVSCALSLLLAVVSHVLCLTCMCHHHAQHTLKSALSAHPAPSRDPSLLFVICLECASTLCANTRAYVIFALPPTAVYTLASMCMRGEFVYVCSTHMRHKSCGVLRALPYEEEKRMCVILGET